MDPEEIRRRARARAPRMGVGAEHATAATGGHHRETEPGRSTRVPSTTATPTPPAASRSVAGDFAGENVTAHLDGGSSTVRGSLAVRIAVAGGAPAVHHYDVHGELAWDNTGSTGFRGTATAADGSSTRVVLVLSGRGHLRVELLHAAEVATIDGVPSVSDRSSFEADRGDGRTVLTDHGDAALTAGVAAGESYPDEDVILEQIAHVFAYQETLGPDSVRTLESWGWRVVPHAPLAADLGFLALAPIPGHPEPRSPVLAFRGTEPTHGEDWLDDFDGEGVGMYQFSRNEAVILAALRQLGNGVTVTGHSLGGALAQICAARYPSHVGNIVTFQSPGISAELAERVAHEHIDSRHHVVDGCVVSGAGEAHTPGTTFHHHADVAIDPLHAHITMPLAEETEATLPEGAGFGPNPRWRYTSATETTEDPSIGAFEGVRRYLSYRISDPVRDEYVRAWSEVRAAARTGRTSYRELVEMCESAPDGAGMRQNLDMMFPELSLAGDAETGIYNGDITSEEEFVAAVEAGPIGPLTSAQRERLHHYWDNVRGLSPLGL